MKKFALSAMFLGLLGLGSVGCEPSVQDEREDVMEAQQEAAEDVREEQQDVIDAQREGNKDVIEEQKDVNEARREGARNVQEERSELNEAQRKEINETTPPATVPPTNP